MKQTIIAMLAGASSAAMQWGWCGLDPAPVYNFSPERYAGTWYEIYRDKDLWYEKPDVECVTATYTYNTNDFVSIVTGYPVGVNNRSYNRAKDTITTTTIAGTEINYARAKFNDNGQGKVKFWWYPEGNYQVIDTDYTSYAIVYGCDNWGVFNTNEIWLLSRTPTLP